MESKAAIQSLGALAQETRLAIFRMLVQQGPAGLSAGTIGDSLKLAPARFKALHGAARAVELAGDRETARSYYVRLVTVAAAADTQRPELAQAKTFLGSK